MLRKIRIVFATIFFIGITLLFLDITGATHAWLGWMAKVQFLPALMALNVGVIAVLVALTLVMGRVYCSVICPLGVMQDIMSWLGGRGKKRRYRFSYSPAMTWLRMTVLVLFVLAIVVGISSFVALLAPYSSYGRIVSNLFSPVYVWVNNLLADIAEHFDSYAFYSREVWIRSASVFAVAALTFVILFVLAWRNGRTYCNTVCPVGTVLGFLSRFSLLKINIDSEKCNACGLCSRRCKAACIDGKNHTVDYSRCVACFDCIDTCTHGAISYGLRRKSVKTVSEPKPGEADSSRRSFITVTAALAGAAAMKAADKTVDGGMAVILDKQIPERKTPIVPPGAKSLRNVADRCTGCQLCVQACPNGVLRPSGGVLTLMQPTSSYERGYCRPECTACSDVCPAGAIEKIDVAEKSSIQIGHAVWIRKNCIPVVNGDSCGNCARHCPVGAITMVPLQPGKEDSPKIPAVNTERCIGCGACENLCPARPFSAIYVEGHEVHRKI